MPEFLSALGIDRGSPALCDIIRHMPSWGGGLKEHGMYPWKLFVKLPLTGVLGFRDGKMLWPEMNFYAFYN